MKFASDKQRAALHPTQKPVDLFRYLLRTYTRPGDLVLDPVAGSGTTGEACLREGRRFLLVEREAEYCAITRRRLDEATAAVQQAVAG